MGVLGWWGDPAIFIAKAASVQKILAPTLQELWQQIQWTAVMTRPLMCWY